MDADEFTQRVRDDNETPLSRLGSSKSLYALTGGEMDGDTVRAAVAREATLTAAAVADWTDTDGTDEATAELYDDLAARAESHAETAGAAPSDRAYPELDRLAAATSTPERLGALLARQILAETRIGQAVGFFVGDADPTSADEFRSLRDDHQTDLERVADRLDDVCAEDDWTTAREAADDLLEAAYDDYVATLESMGVKPKNVC